MEKMKYAWIFAAAGLVFFMWLAGCTSSKISDPRSDQYLTISLIQGKPGAKGVSTGDWLLYVDCVERLYNSDTKACGSAVVDDLVLVTVKNTKKATEITSGNLQDVLLDRYRISYNPTGIIVDADGDSIFEGKVGSGTGPAPYIPIGSTATFSIIAAPTFSKPTCFDRILTGTITLWGRTVAGQEVSITSQFTVHHADWVNDPKC